jgi:hypothetical protein
LLPPQLSTVFRRIDNGNNFKQELNVTCVATCIPLVMWYYCAVDGESKKIVFTSRATENIKGFLESPQEKIIFKTLQAPAQ